ncbi:unnamed protein product, partial [Meganyctiphanes norvegica]|uniref:alpha-mannosidase n=1 Tax=Meganyctiphanes norvegica TaxID=48144 RepID=A0AAV2QGI6_MEGNR
MDNCVNVTASLHKNYRTTLERIEKFISEIYFIDVNLRGKLYPTSNKITDITHWALPGGDGAWEKWTFDQIRQQPFTPVKIGDSFGPTWSTHWFKLQFNIPDEWCGKEVRLRWKSQSESMVWSKEGEPLQGLSTGISHQMRSDFRISQCWDKKSESFCYYIEMACNNMFGAGNNGMISPPDMNKQFTLELAEISVFDVDVYKLLIDLQILHDMAKNLKDDIKGYDALYTGNEIINRYIKGEIKEAILISKEFFSKGNGSRNHTLAAIGHCHIDSAWLWNYSESKRKCARSWISAIGLMNDYPEMVFACSQAQQFAWVKEHYPQIFMKIKDMVEYGQFIPVGGSWVEMDGLLPSGESFMRQFLYGQQFYLKEFGLECKEFWLPDTFGYSSQIPQICMLFGINRFLTQKLSWSLVNKFPHHNFLWEGLDGSTILAHFPPGDSYEMNVTVDECLRTVKNLQDKGRVSTSAFLYGFGDGGGGPTQDMLERAKRLSDVDGCPKLQHMTPDSFFKCLESDRPNLCRWVGELYLELHNGTYTSQANTKLQNRKCEFILRETEFVLAVAAITKQLNTDRVQHHQINLVDAWKKVLLNQFHDVIPGSSIGSVYKDSDKLYEEVKSVANAVKKECISCCLQTLLSSTGRPVIVNSLPWKVKKVIEVDDVSFFTLDSTPEKDSNSDSSVGVDSISRKRFKMDGLATQPAITGGQYIPVEASGMGWSTVKSCEYTPVTVERNNDTFVLKNELIECIVSNYGELLSLRLIVNNKDVFNRSESYTKTGNKLMLFDDIPLYWDAWDTMDYHLETGKVLNDNCSDYTMTPVKIVESGPLMVKLEWSLQISDLSSLTQEIELSAFNPYIVFNTKVNWNENRKFLKVMFDTRLNSRIASFDTQFGFLERPTHKNTSWDSAKFEVCGHKWADISEYDFGLSVLNDCKYGWSTNGGALTLSLLRSPKAPDDQCDMGKHQFSYAAMPHAGTHQSADVPKRAYEFNIDSLVPPINLRSNKTFGGIFFNIHGEGVMIEAVKLAEDNINHIVLRMFEMYGGSTSAILEVHAPREVAAIYLCDGMERPLNTLRAVPITQSEITNEENFVKMENFYHINLDFSPFQIVNLKLAYSE